MKTIKILYSYDTIKGVKEFTANNAGHKKSAKFLEEIKKEYLNLSYFVLLRELKELKRKHENYRMRYKMTSVERERLAYLSSIEIKAPIPLQVFIETI